jgi:glycosyltransferase involved in cell wall biosynthesis
MLGNDKVGVTIGMCVKNSEATIEEAIASVLNQNFPHKVEELVVVDGYSKDRTLALIKKALSKTDIRTRVFRENKGLGNARQMVVDRAIGKYIIWVDSDMVLSTNFVRDQVAFMERNPRVGIAKGKYGALKSKHQMSLVTTLENVEFMVYTMFGGETSSKALGTSGCIYRVEAVKGVGGFDPNIVGACEDIDVEYRIRAAGWLIYISQAIFYENRRQTWTSLWREYFWHGYGWHFLLVKNRDLVNIYKLVPPIAIAAEFLRLPKAYSITNQKKVFLLPLHYVFKRTAWFLGFMKGRLNLRK